MEADKPAKPANGAESLLLGLKRNGVEYLFANAGTDFPPLIEAMASLPAEAIPQPVTIPHETAAVAMAHGYFLVTGRPQSVMVHVNVGLANTVMGVINAASDNIPMLVMSGRTPLTETGRAGARTTPIHYGQEMYDQTSLVRDSTKYQYEMRYPEQGAALVSRSLSIANTAPAGPVYLSLPREPLCEALTEQAAGNREPAAAASPISHPDPESIELLARWLAEANRPVIICQRGDVRGRLAAALSAFAERQGIAVSSPFVVRNVLESSHPAFAGYNPAEAYRDADLVIVLDSATPWIASGAGPGPDARIAHIGPDPHFSNRPVRGYRSDLLIQADPAAAIDALSSAMGEPRPGASGNLEELRQASRGRRAKMLSVSKEGRNSPMTAEWMSHCISEAMDKKAVVFSDLGALPEHMEFAGPNRFFNSPHSGGLGWAMAAALGAQLADRERLTIACVGDGSYMFANPVACHQIAEALELPILTIIKNNAMWNAVRRSVLNSYPRGNAAKTNRMPLTSLEPLPDFVAISKASRAHAERIEDGAQLPAALERAIKVIRTEKRQALLDLNILPSDAF